MLIARDAPCRGLIRRGPHSANVIADAIVWVSTGDANILYERWLSCEPPVSKNFQPHVHRLLLRSLLAFCVCVTERFIVFHKVTKGKQFATIIAAVAREMALANPTGDSAPLYPLPTVDFPQAHFLGHHIDWMRRKYPYRKHQAVVPPELLELSARVIAVHLRYGFVLSLEIEELLAMLRGQLTHDAGLLMSSRPYEFLAAGVGKWNGGA